ncbi:Low-density lipoprotein receptor-related protein 2 [Mizuhopecten yessoensis]|uniref:Low-density lipoprotein receptor-related protein 2 n=1 Tax=Mizuhopecten yessoensis TaxID=6573 RepID=A0A210PS12_MIZYE|nr:Low-density lipoprotein receptor-related protein 2 [Mizuhopecten yessoensis]
MNPGNSNERVNESSKQIVKLKHYCPRYSQLIGEEKKYVFLEQAVLERVRSTLLEMTNTLEARVGRLEEDNKRTEMSKALEERLGLLEKELNTVKNMNPINPSTAMSINSCPANLFRCDNGLCIPREWVCDHEIDCSDKSDEKCCK